MNEEFGILFKNEALKYEEELLEQLTGVIDPELGIDIANLGLIYEVDMDEAGKVEVIMTLTTAGCPLADFIDSDVRYQLANFDKITEIDIKVVFEPHWDLSRISRFARIALGIPSDFIPN
ncbi:MAG: metal-sulfur cluster assembly factor [Ruoffia tabacinasalis]|mgnify:FL=1|uniref:Metal-sulfur cluster assembly factor n=2 Tax=Ruoffia TaxID=2862144 RepID=A0A839A347_9LACT|nr:MULTISPECIES: metal-sulfur cluster assembly factor [Ruoffia]MBA5728218.1 metal-sulfur cluster assembly factor [Ruoffia halotolerans]TLQ48825.1 metal-sulfur cluster assembly factor [Ruoffia tabacinasalis]HBY90861.1 aromatic ring hydroxylase [Aerococcaceae bacterium]